MKQPQQTTKQCDLNIYKTNYKTTATNYKTTALTYSSVKKTIHMFNVCTCILV